MINQLGCFNVFEFASPAMSGTAAAMMAVMVVSAGMPAKPITVSCVGDSITTDAGANSYPAQLGTLLGSG